KALGRLANAELRKAKSLAHRAFDDIWRDKHMSRSQAYSWLAESLGIEKKDCHIGMFDVDMCMRVVDVSENYTATKALL
ncbi:MAG: zinc-finger-containing protein, partial [Enterobacterales bacterium]